MAPAGSSDPGPPSGSDEPRGSTRCADVAEALSASPNATAPHHLGFLLVESPLPWPRDLKERADLAALGDLLGAHGIRLQLVQPTSGEPPGRLRTVVLHRARGGGGAGYRSVARLVPPAADLLAVAGSMLESELPDAAPPEVDVLICAHGRRDVCCGSRGTVLAQAVARGSSVGGRVRIWRTSHLGGHRFAPTVLVLPHGTMWSRADADLVDAVVGLSGHPSGLLDRYRGNPAMPAAVQAVEQLALCDVGWSWLRWSRTWRHRDGMVELRGRSPRGDSQVWRARVVVGRSVPTPACGAALEESTDVEHELVVRDLQTFRV